MPKAKHAIPILPTSPVTLTCPYCKARPGHDCATTAGGFAAVHVQRIKAAAARNKANVRKREDFSQAAARIVKRATEE